MDLNQEVMDVCWSEVEDQDQNQNGQNEVPRPFALSTSKVVSPYSHASRLASITVVPLSQSAI